MIVKKRDATLATIKKLEAKAVKAADSVKRAACASAASRLRADPTTEFATDLIDGQFAHSEEWAVVHDLRLRVKGHALQINHLLVSNTLGFVCVDTRFLKFGLKEGEGGQFHMYNDHESRRIASPLNKIGKEVRMFRDHIQEMGILPKRFGLVQKAILKGYVLTNPAFRLDLNMQSTSRNIDVCSSDSLFPMLWKQDQKVSRVLGSTLSADELHELAAQLAELHSPAFSQSLLENESLATDHTRSILAACG